MVTCSVSDCCTTQRNNPEKCSFHRFPTNLDTRNKWLKLINRPNWVPHKNSSVCSKHFEEKYFLTRRSKRLLKKSAIPTMFVPSTTINAAIIENPTPSNASPSNYTPSTTSDSILPTPEEQDLPGHSSYDEYQIFGDYVANEIRNMNYLKYKGELKRKIQKLIIEYTEKDENEYLAHTNFESPAETVSFIEVPTSKAISSEVPSTSQDLFMESKPFVPKLEIIDDPLPEIE